MVFFLSVADGPGVFGYFWHVEMKIYGRSDGGIRHVQWPFGGLQNVWWFVAGDTRGSQILWFWCCWNGLESWAPSHHHICFCFLDKLTHWRWLSSPKRSVFHWPGPALWPRTVGMLGSQDVSAFFVWCFGGGSRIGIGCEFRNIWVCFKVI